ncbi:AAA family ATPase [Arthrobacter koreensis]|uniref:AAA family ATPase n=1 Tax=Arthrobacter koreensis TaxID=199136 RepID=UPI00126570D8|nr:AAA family ATPase [Arthrobacter koreensis]
MSLSEIRVTAEYCFGGSPMVLANLAKVNFVHAPNGSGKTTISNALSRQPLEPDSRSTWQVAETASSIRVFNESYRSTVLNEHVDGIFTIGSESDDVNSRIALLDQERAARRIDREGWTKAVGSDRDRHAMSGLLGEIEDERLAASQTLFEGHKDVPEAVRETVFRGFRASREKFFKEAESRYEPDLVVEDSLTWDTLEARNASLTGDLHRRSQLPGLSVNSLLSEEQIKQLRVDDVTTGSGDLAALIQHLANGDWVSQGRQHLENANNKCPFCQEDLPEGFGSRLTAYFAAGYDEALSLAESITTQVESRSVTLRAELVRLKAAIEADTAIGARRFIDAIDAIQTATELVLSKVSDKRRHPTNRIDVNDIDSLTRHLRELIEDANKDIIRHNKLIDDSSLELQKLVDDGWALFLTRPEILNQLKRYTGISARKRAKIEELRTNIASSLQADEDSEDEIETLRDSISNTAAVAERINKLLEALGFHRFHLEITDAVAGGYRIIRDDGSPAFDSLSEGEKSFLCFAYFVESLTGSAVPGGIVEPVIAVIDDPISSLDSDTLFIVAAYIRDIAKQVIAGETNIEQLIVLTHNTQFHHEAAYATDIGKTGDRRHYRLRKGLDKLTTLKDDGQRSKIRGSYELLWQSVVDIADGDEESPIAQVGVFNIVRRIIEGYFKTVGSTLSHERQQPLSVADERLMSMFITWANSGSHTIIDDFAQSHYIGDAKDFLQLLHLFFDQQGHGAHFDMMVRACGGESLLETGAVFGRFPQSLELAAS